MGFLLAEQRVGSVGLRVEIDEQDALSLAGQAGDQVDAGRGLAPPPCDWPMA
jgi:hypothetical protein